MRMTIPRKMLVDEEAACTYHLTSRCVRGMYLCGWDRSTRKKFAHRRRWLVKRARALAKCFAVELYAYAVMSNHFHLILHYDPTAKARWSDEEVVRRWVEAFPPRMPSRARLGRIAAAASWERRKARKREQILADADRIARLRETLGSLSGFMKHLKQPIARRANLEEDCYGHFFDMRFYSGALLSEKAIVAAMAYVDLNPIRAKITKRVAEYGDVSIAERVVEHSKEALAAYLRPLSSGLQKPDSPRTLVATTLEEYIELLEAIATAETTPAAPLSDDVGRWRVRMYSIRKRQRAYGPENLLKQWTTARNFRPMEVPLPE